MHVPDGILSAPICLTGVIGTIGASCWAIRGLRDDQLPRIAVLTALFFVVGTLHIRIGPGSVHLLCTGLLAVVLGWRAILAVVAGVLLHAILLQHGGLTTIGINALVLGLPAMAVGWWIERGAPNLNPRRAWILGAAGTLAVYGLSIALFLAVIGLTDSRLVSSLGIWAAMHAPVMAIEAVVTGSAFAFLTRIGNGAPRTCCALE